MICENCGKEHDGSYGSGRFCCKECARSFSTKKDHTNQKKEAKCVDCGKIIYIGKRAPIDNCRCDRCKKLHSGKYKLYGDDIERACPLFNIRCKDCYFYKNKICNNRSFATTSINTLKKYFDFNVNNNYEDILNQYLSIKNNIQMLLDEGYSSNELCEKLFGGVKRGNTIFGILQCKTRTLGQSIANAFLQGKLKLNDGNTEYHTEWHTSWEGKEFYLRSSYESDYAKYLDDNKIKYEVESLRIKYFDTSNNEYRCAIPDFYLIDTNTIVEIKSNWTLDIQNMKDKVNAYKDLGYNFKLILNHNEVDINTL